MKQNASEVVARAAGGETITVTLRGEPVAQLTAIPASRLEELVSSGRARSAGRSIADLPMPPRGPNLSAVLAEMRDDERY